MSSRGAHLTRLHVHDLSLLCEPFNEDPFRETSSSSELHAEAEVPFHGEATDPFDTLSCFFEADCALQGQDGGTSCDPAARKASLPPPCMHPRLPIFPTSASCYAALLHRRGVCLRDVLSAVSKHAEGQVSDSDIWPDGYGIRMDSGGGASHSSGRASGASMRSASEAGDEAEASEPDIVQQLLCSFIELASNTRGPAATRSLQQVGQLLATQRPLVLAAQRASWLPQLLSWLSGFLSSGNSGSTDGQQHGISVRGAAAAAMLDLGVCSGSLRCILLTVESLLSNSLLENVSGSSTGGDATSEATQTAAAGQIDCERITASVRRLWASCCDTPSSSPVGGCTFFLPVLQLESRTVYPAPRPLSMSSAASSSSARGAPYPRSQITIKPLPGASSRFVSVATDGSYLYIHSAGGLAKLGSGFNGTIPGHLYACKPRYRVSEKPWIACVGSRLYMRSPAMVPDCLVLLDCGTLEEIGNVRTDGKGSVPSPNSGSSLLPEQTTSSSGFTFGAGSGGGGGGGGEPSYRSSGSVSLHHDAAGGGSRSRGGAGAGDAGEMLGGSMLGSVDMEMEAAADMDDTFVEEPPALRSFYADIRRQQQQRRGSSLTDPTRQLRTALSAESESRRVSCGESGGGGGGERSPLISDGKLLYIVSKSHDKSAPASHQHNHSELHDDEDDSSEGGGQIGSTWAVGSFSLDVYDPADGMRLVRSVGIKGPACDQGMREAEGEGALCCDVCGLVMSGAAVGYRCFVCAPEYDLCHQCHMRGSATGGHRPEHAVRQMDCGSGHEAVGEQVLLPAFPAECLEYQSFYCDGKVLMVLIPPHLFGSKTPGHLCRVFCALEGRHLYDISMGDSQEDPRRDLGKPGLMGAACFDAHNDLVWHIDSSAVRARRWRHPWTVPLQGKEGDGGSATKELPANATVAQAMQSILSCLYNASEKLSRSVQEPCHDALQPWTPFCVEAVSETFAAISRIMALCAKQPEASLHIVRTCMRLLQVNLGHVSGQACKFADSLLGLREHVMNLADSASVPPSDNTLFSSTLDEASRALVAGLDAFYPDAEQQAQLLCELLSRPQGGGRVLTAVASHLSKPGAHHHVFRIFDGTWLKGSKDRESLAQRLIELLVKKVVAEDAPAETQSEGNASVGEGSAGAAAPAASNSTSSNVHLLALLGSFQRQLLSTPLSSIRATAESEALLLFYAKMLLSCSGDVLNRSLNGRNAAQQDMQDDTTVPCLLALDVVRVLLLSFATALADQMWSQNLSGNLARDLLPDLRNLLETTDKINRLSPSLRYQDMAFSVRCTEPQYVGGKIVSIPRARNVKPCCVKFPGATSVVVRIGEDLVLGKRETLRIQSFRDTASSSSTGNTIKGGQRSKRLWRSFTVQGDTAYITYNRSAGSVNDDPKSPRLIRCSVYGCVRNSALLMPLDWMLDLELTLASLFARATRSIFREPPRPSCVSKWVSSPFFQDGLNLKLLDREQSTEMDVDDATSPESDLLAGLVLPDAGDRSAFGACALLKLKEHLASTIWRSCDMHLSLGMHCIAALVKSAGLTSVAASHTAGAALPQELAYVVQASVDLIHQIVVDLRRQEQMAVLRRAEDVAQRDGMDTDAAVAAGCDTGGDVKEDDVECIKRGAADQCAAKVHAMQARAKVLIACRAQGLDAWVKEWHALAEEEKARISTDSIGEVSGDMACGLRLCVKSALGFISSDLPPESLIAAAGASARIATQRLGAISWIRSLLETLQFTSVRQAIVATFTSGVAPFDAQRNESAGINVTSNLHVCDKALLDSLRSQHAQLYTYLASLLETTQQQSHDNALEHLVLQAWYALDLTPECLTWLDVSRIVPRLGGLVLARVATVREDRDEVESELDACGLWEAAMTVFSRITIACVQMSVPQHEGMREALQSIMCSVICVATELFTKIDALPATEARSILQMHTLVWLHSVVSRSECAQSYASCEGGLIKSLCTWTLNAESPQVQRVAMRVMTHILCTSQRIDTTMLKQWVDDTLDLAGRVLCPSDENVPAPPVKDSLDSCAEQTAHILRSTSTDTAVWKVVLLPVARGELLEADKQAALEEACMRALAGLAKESENNSSSSASGGSKSSSANEAVVEIAARVRRAAQSERAKEAALLIAQGKEAPLFQGGREDCQSVCLQLDTRDALPLVCRVRPASQGKGLMRWRSGSTSRGVALDMLAMLRDVAQATACQETVCACLVDALSALAVGLGSVSGAGKQVESAGSKSVDIQRALACMEMLCWGANDFNVRAGSHIQLVQGSAKGACMTGRVFHVDSISGTLSYVPVEVMRSRSLQQWIPITVPLHLAQPIPPSQVSFPPQLARGVLPAVLRCLTEFFSLDARPQPLPAAEGCRLLQRVHARAHHVISVVLECGDSTLTQSVLAAGLLPLLIDKAAQHACEDRVTLEQRSDIVCTHLCEHTFTAPPCLLARSRLTGSASDRAPGSEGGSSGLGVSGSSGGGSGRPRGIPGMDALLRTSRHSQRQDQRRSRELAAANLADITGQPLRLCQLALDRENGNQDRAANWLFEHGEGFLAEHPEYAEVPEGSGEAGGGGQGGWEEPEMPMYMLRDCFSYVDDSQGLAGGGDDLSGQGGGGGGDGAGPSGLDLPSTVLDELRAIGTPMEDAARAYEDRVFGGSLLPRNSRNAVPVPVHRKAADTDLRAGMYVAVSSADVEVHWPSEGLHGIRLVGGVCAMDRIGVVESVERGSEGAKVVLYDPSQGVVHTIQQPIASLDRITRQIGGLYNIDCSSHDVLQRTSTEVDGMLACAYARACVASLLRSYNAGGGVPCQVVVPGQETREQQQQSITVVREGMLGGRARVVKLVHASAIEYANAHCSNAALGSNAGAAASGNTCRLSDVVAASLHAMLDAECGVSTFAGSSSSTGGGARNNNVSTDDTRLPKESPKRKIDEAIISTSSVGGGEDTSSVGEGSGGRDKRRRLPGEAATTQGDIAMSDSGVSTNSSVDAAFHKVQDVVGVEDALVSLACALHEECLQALKAALTAASILEEASEHPLVRGGGSGALASSSMRRCLHAEGVTKIFVVFDTRCALLPGESIKFYSDATCTDVIAVAVLDDRRKAYPPLLLPSPVWMQVSSSGGGAEEGESTWGYRVVAFPLAEKNISVAIWLSSFLADRMDVPAPGVPVQRATALMEGLLELLDKATCVATPHCIQLHSLATRLVPEVVRSAEGYALLASHATFTKLTTEATHRHTWETRSGSGERSVDNARRPVSSYLGSLSELLACRSAALQQGQNGGGGRCAQGGGVTDFGAVVRKVNEDMDVDEACGASMDQPSCTAPLPSWLVGMAEVIRMASCLYGGKRTELDVIEGVARALFAPESQEEDTTRLPLIDESTKQMSTAAKEALCEVFQHVPEAAQHLTSWLAPQQASSTQKVRDFLRQVEELLHKDEAKVWGLLERLDFDRDLVRWSPERDADLVALVNMSCEAQSITPSDMYMVDLDDSSRRRLPRLACVPPRALQRRFLILKLFNYHLDSVLPLADLSRRTSRFSFGTSICELQHLIFYSAKAVFHNAVLQWTACSSRSNDRNFLTVLLHRPGRRARDTKEKAEDHERWRLQVSSEGDTDMVCLEEFLVAPSDFGSAREMGADAIVSSRLVRADPPNGSLPLRNADEVAGSVVLIERGGGQFVNVIRRAQEAGARAVIISDSKEGPLFLMSTELGNSGDEIRVPAVLLSLADSMLLMQRTESLRASILADGVFMQTYRQLRHTQCVRLRQRDEMAWRVIFHGEGHQGYQGPYREALSALCAELLSPRLPLFIPCANAENLVGDNRDKYVPRPSSLSHEHLEMFFFVGQLMGVAMRTRNLLSLDLPSLVWKCLAGVEVDEEDLKATDYSCWSTLQFRDEDGQTILAERFTELFPMCFTTCLTDGKEVPLLEGGRNIPVTYQRREEYRRLVVKFRLEESSRQLAKMRAGLCSLIPEPLLGIMSWEELERRVCGSPDVDVASLRRHTRYRCGVTEDSPHVQMFWEVLQGFSQAERRLFLRFAWGRERLPLESDYTEQSEMKMFPSTRGDGDSVLPEAETCFFIIKMPKYRTKEIMQRNLLSAITACREINY